jgi:hypothetical protein
VAAATTINKIQCRGVSELQPPRLKNKNFFRKEARPLCRNQRVKEQSVRHAPPLAGSASKQKHGAGVVQLVLRSEAEE